MTGTVLNAAPSPSDERWTFGLGEVDVIPENSVVSDLDRVMEIQEIVSKMDDTQDNVELANTTLDTITTNYAPGLEASRFMDTLKGVGARIQAIIKMLLKMGADLLKALYDRSKEMVEFGSTRRRVMTANLNDAERILKTPTFKNQRITLRVGANSVGFVSVAGRPTQNLTKALEHDGRIVGDLANRGMGLMMNSTVDDLELRILDGQGSAKEIAYRSYLSYLELGSITQRSGYGNDPMYGSLLVKTEHQFVGNVNAIKRIMSDPHDDRTNDANFIGYFLEPVVTNTRGGVNMVMLEKDMVELIGALKSNIKANGRLAAMIESDMKAIKNAERRLRRLADSNRTVVDHQPYLRQAVRLTLAITTNAPRYSLQVFRHSMKTITSITSLLTFTLKTQ